MAQRVPRGISGKLIAVLDHIRSGIGEHSESIVKAYKARGMEPPARLLSDNVPTPKNGELLYWEGFLELATTRQSAGLPIPWTAIDAYTRALPVYDGELFRWVIRRLDNHLLKEAREND